MDQTIELATVVSDYAPVPVDHTGWVLLALIAGGLIFRIVTGARLRRRRMAARRLHSDYTRRRQASQQFLENFGRGRVL
jgi:hypothetical protein